METNKIATAIFTAKCTFAWLCTFILASALPAVAQQGGFFPLSSYSYQLLDRLETISGNLNDTICLSYHTDLRTRSLAAGSQLMANPKLHISRQDSFLWSHLYSENHAFDPSDTLRKKQFSCGVFNDKVNLLELRKSGFVLQFNPVLYSEVTNEQSSGKTAVHTLNIYGAEVKGAFCKNFGYYLKMAECSESLPSFLNNYAIQRKVVPGFGTYTGNATFQYADISGHVTLGLVRGHVLITAGNGKNFIGDGIRSLLISDNSGNTNYLKIDTRIWKFNYQNLFLELTPEYASANNIQSHTYAAMHQLNLNLTHWLNTGIFEAIIFNRPNSYEVDYLNPIIFYRYTERTNGSPDNALIGFNAKALAAKHLQFYGQFLLDEFTAKQFFGGHGYWANKYGIQGGIKYFNAFNVENLDLQCEVNAVRPFTFSHSDTIINYTNLNQPLADPLGSGFIESIVTATYRPAKKWEVSYRGTWYLKGADTAGTNFGNDVFVNYITHYQNYGVPWISGAQTHCLISGINLTYRVTGNLFIDAGACTRSLTANTNQTVSSTTGVSTGNQNNSWYYFGIRFNATRRAYDTYF